MGTKIALSKTAQAKIEREARKKCKELAKESKEVLEEKYQNVIDEFYMELPNPKQYIRHEDRGQGYSRGLKQTYETIYKKENNVYKGGIVITDKNMYDGYRGTHTQVLWSFLMGFHGLPHENLVNMVSENEALDKKGLKFKFSQTDGISKKEVSSLLPSSDDFQNVGGIKPLKEMREFFEELVDRMTERAKE